MSRRTATTLAWAALGFDLLVHVTAIVLGAIGAPLSPELETHAVNVFALSIAAFGLLGALMVTRRPANRTPEDRRPAGTAGTSSSARQRGTLPGGDA